MSTSIRKEIRWHDRMEARVAGGILLLVTLSLAAVVVTATRVSTRSAVARAADNLEGARSAFYRLVDERAAFATQQTRLITELPLFRSMMINPVIAQDVATLTEMAESYRQSLNAQFAIVTSPDGRPSATPGWPQGQAMPASLQTAIQGATAGESRRDIVPIDGKLILVTSEPAKFAEAEVLGTVTFGFPLDDRVAQQLAQITRADINLVSGNRLAGSSLSAAEQKDVVVAPRRRQSRQRERHLTWSEDDRRARVHRRHLPTVPRSLHRRRPSGAAAGLGADAGVSRRIADLAPLRRRRRLRARARRRIVSSAIARASR